jgi:tRNA-splicing ligase RtcB
MSPNAVITEGHVPVKSWAIDAEDGAVQQAVNLSRLPFASHHVALMPDAHQGYGMPIGGVLFAEEAVVPYAVGVDIGCGVALIETSLTVDALPPQTLAAVLQQIARDVPVGNGPQGSHRVAGDHFGATRLDERAETAPILEAADRQLGTLGGGNHFIEVQRDDAGKVYVMLHSGSRSVGKKLCDLHYRIAKDLCDRWRVELPDRELAFLPWETDEAQAYFGDMTDAMLWAEENRNRMAAKVIYALGRHAKAEAWVSLDVHHNYAAWESHYGRNGIVHRKGAVRARAGERVLIPGSMGTASYIAEGLGNPESFESCQHGAGRLLGRGAARRAITSQAMESDLAAIGVQLVTPNRAAVVDEAPRAYKDIDAVMAASADLVRPLVRLRPLGVVKG